MSTLRTITAFKSKLAGGGARPNLFEVEIPTFPTALADTVWDGTAANQEGDMFRFMCKGAQLPASNIAEIPVPFRGRILKVAGDRTFDTWTVTVINDESFMLRNAFESWMNAISRTDTNTGATNPSSYMTNAMVHQLGRGYSKGAFATAASNSKDNTTVTPLKSYTFFDIFPTEISAIDLSYDNSDVIEEFTVTFQVQYWAPGVLTDEGEDDD